MAYCSNCGKEISAEAVVCPSCGFEIKKVGSGRSIASLVLGILGLFTWLLPIIGLPMSIVGLVLGATGMKRGSRGLAIAGLVLSIIALVLTIINASIGAYMGYRGELGL